MMKALLALAAMLVTLTRASYENPYDGPCPISGEVNSTLPGAPKGSGWCSKSCESGFDCPIDLPDGSTKVYPQCVNVVSSSKKICAMRCSQQSTCPGVSTCVQTASSGTSVCAYDEPTKRTCLQDHSVSCCAQNDPKDQCNALTEFYKASSGGDGWILKGAREDAELLLCSSLLFARALNAA